MNQVKANGKFQFLTKGRTLQQLLGCLSKSKILPLKMLSYKNFVNATPDTLIQLFNQFGVKKLIVRSSFSEEDCIGQSNAGKFLSIANVENNEHLFHAIDKVFASYGPSFNENEEVLIQPQLESVKNCGVIFTKEPSRSANYYVITDDITGSTDSVTSGLSNQIQTYIVMKNHKQSKPLLKKLLPFVDELCEYFACESIDVEYAIDKQGQLWLLQIRPLACLSHEMYSTQQHKKHAKIIEEKIKAITSTHPYLYGQRSVLGVMPDWNPAEIIGLYPKPLALSLYKNLVTDSIWAYQRNNYGYQNLRSFPLMVDFFGLPYIDVRVSFNSFLPRGINKDLANKLVNYYIDSLIDNPSHHDSVEFNIVLSCYSLDIKKKMSILQDKGFSEQECSTLSYKLLSLTNRIIDPRTGLWIQDLHRIEQLKQRYKTVKNEINDPIQRIYWLLEDCKRYGTLPFAGLARAAFIAVQLLRSLKVEGVFSEDEYHDYLGSLNTVSGQMTHDFNHLSQDIFLNEYGHLRPGTYDICSPRYDQASEQYFSMVNQEPEDIESKCFSLSDDQYQLLQVLLAEHGINHSAGSLLHFIKSAIEGREYAKFVFSRSLSDAIEEFANLGQSYGFSRDDLAFANIEIINQLISTSCDIEKVIAESIEAGKKSNNIGKMFKLPPLITSAQDIYSFELSPTEPNFITNKKIIADVVMCSVENDLSGKIIFIPSADPGYDWIFSHQIAGFITAFGGCNSHMAIRANELGIPAVIGAGENVFEKWSKVNTLEVDCENNRVKIIQ